MKWLCAFIFFRLMNWQEHVTVAMPQRCVLALAPHTSNWDFIIGRLYYAAKGRRAHFLMKREWFFPPVGLLMRRLGGIPVNRKKKTSLTDQLAALAREKPYFHLAVTPEGTRSLNREWKRGFYYVAAKAELPILLFALDYQHRQIVCTRSLFPSNDVEQDMTDIQTYYRQFTGKHPHKFGTSLKEK